jgi:hypothetical protein
MPMMLLFVILQHAQPHVGVRCGEIALAKFDLLTFLPLSCILQRSKVHFSTLAHNQCVQLVSNGSSDRGCQEAALAVHPGLPALG